MVDLVMLLGSLGSVTDVISNSSQLVVTTNSTTKILTLGLGGYVTMVSPDSKGEDFPMPKLSAFAEISDTKVVGDLIGSFMIRSDNSDGPTWSLPGPNGQVMWLALRRKTLVFTTDADVLRRSAKSPSRAQWRLPNDSVKQSGVLRVSIPSIAWLVMSQGFPGAISREQALAPA